MVRQAAKGEPCIRCHTEDGTTVLAHYSGKYSNRFGKGVGCKSHDLAGAHLCQRCHNYFDSYENGNDDTRAAEFMMYCLLTVIKLQKQGVIKV